jgi:hypothetical protein
MECKYGFIPGSGETVANRIRRKFRMTKGGNPQLILVHYSRGQAVRKSPSPSKTYPILNMFLLRDSRLYSVFTKRQPSIPYSINLPARTPSNPPIFLRSTSLGRKPVKRFYQVHLVVLR